MKLKNNCGTYSPWHRVENWLLLFIPIVWYVLFQLDFIQQISQSDFIKMYHDTVARIIPSINGLKNASNFDYPNAAMHSTFWLFLPYFASIGYSNIILSKHAQSLFLKRTKLGQCLVLSALFVMMLYWVIYPFPIMHKGTDKLYFNTNFFGIIGLMGASGGFLCLGLFFGYLKIAICNCINDIKEVAPFD